MTAAADILCVAFKGGSLTVLARVLGGNAVAIVQADVSAIEYTAWLLDEADPDDRAAIAGHTAKSVDKTGAIFDTLQSDALWTVDAIGYNFRHVLDVFSDQVFTIAGRRVLLEFTITPAVGQVILVRFRVNVI